MERKFLTYGRMILAVDEIVSISVGKSNVPSHNGRNAINVTLKTGTEWSSCFDSDEELLKTFGDIQKALNAAGNYSGDLTMEDILSDGDQED